MATNLSIQFTDLLEEIANSLGGGFDECFFIVQLGEPTT